MQLEAGNCVYNTTVSVSQSEELVLTCNAKTSDSSFWAAIGMGFANDKWQLTGEAPSALVTSSSFATYSVSAIAPAGSKYVSVWFYSDAAAVIDNCQLIVAPLISAAINNPDDSDMIPEPLDGDNKDNLDQGLTDSPNLDLRFNNYENLYQGVTDTPNPNLLSNEFFAPTATGIRDWFIGCDPEGTATTDANGNLLLSGNACVAQSLDATHVQALRGNTFLFECKAIKESMDYAVIGFNGIETYETSFVNGSFTLLGGVPDDAINGFVGIYSKLGSKTPLLVDNCSLSILGDTVSNDSDHGTDQGGSTDTELYTVSLQASDANAVIKTGEIVELNLANYFSRVEGTAESVDLDPATAGLQKNITTADGKWSVAIDGFLVFIPETDYSGKTQISYMVTDHNDDTSNIANITVDVLNLAPLAPDTDVTFEADNIEPFFLYVLTPDRTSHTAEAVDLNPETPERDGNITTADGSWSVPQRCKKSDCNVAKQLHQ